MGVKVQLRRTQCFIYFVFVPCDDSPSSHCLSNLYQNLLTAALASMPDSFSSLTTQSKPSLPTFDTKNEKHDSALCSLRPASGRVPGWTSCSREEGCHLCLNGAPVLPVVLQTAGSSHRRVRLEHDHCRLQLRVCSGAAWHSLQFGRTQHL